MPKFPKTFNIFHIFPLTFLFFLFRITFESTIETLYPNFVKTTYSSQKGDIIIFKLRDDDLNNITGSRLNLRLKISVLTLKGYTILYGYLSNTTEPNITINDLLSSRYDTNFFDVMQVGNQQILQINRTDIESIKKEEVHLMFPILCADTDCSFVIGFTFPNISYFYPSQYGFLRTTDEYSTEKMRINCSNMKESTPYELYISAFSGDTRLEYDSDDNPYLPESVVSIDNLYLYQFSKQKCDNNSLIELPMHVPLNWQSAYFIKFYKKNDDYFFLQKNLLMKLPLKMPENGLKQNKTVGFTANRGITIVCIFSTNCYFSIIENDEEKGKYNFFQKIVNNTEHSKNYSFDLAVNESSVSYNYSLCHFSLYSLEPSQNSYLTVSENIEIPILLSEKYQSILIQFPFYFKNDDSFNEIENLNFLLYAKKADYKRNATLIYFFDQQPIEKRGIFRLESKDEVVDLTDEMVKYCIKNHLCILYLEVRLNIAKTTNNTKDVKIGNSNNQYKEKSNFAEDEEGNYTKIFIKFRQHEGKGEFIQRNKLIHQIIPKNLQANGMNYLLEYKEVLYAEANMAYLSNIAFNMYLYMDNKREGILIEQYCNNMFYMNRIILNLTEGYRNTCKTVRCYILFDTIPHKAIKIKELIPVEIFSKSKGNFYIFSYKDENKRETEVISVIEDIFFTGHFTKHDEIVNFEFEASQLYLNHSGYQNNNYNNIKNNSYSKDNLTESFDIKNYTISIICSNCIISVHNPNPSNPNIIKTIESFDKIIIPKDYFSSNKISFNFRSNSSHVTLANKLKFKIEPQIFDNVTLINFNKGYEHFCNRSCVFICQVTEELNKDNYFILTSLQPKNRGIITNMTMKIMRREQVGSYLDILKETLSMSYNPKCSNCKYSIGRSQPTIVLDISDYIIGNDDYLVNFFVIGYISTEKTTFLQLRNTNPNIKFNRIQHDYPTLICNKKEENFYLSTPFYDVNTTNDKNLDGVIRFKNLIGSTYLGLFNKSEDYNSKNFNYDNYYIKLENFKNIKIFELHTYDYLNCFMVSFDIHHVKKENGEKSMDISDGSEFEFYNIDFIDVDLGTFNTFETKKLNNFNVSGNDIGYMYYRIKIYDNRKDIDYVFNIKVFSYYNESGTEKINLDYKVDFHLVNEDYFFNNSLENEYNESDIFSVDKLIDTNTTMFYFKPEKSNEISKIVDNYSYIFINISIKDNRKYFNYQTQINSYDRNAFSNNNMARALGIKKYFYSFILTDKKNITHKNQNKNSTDNNNNFFSIIKLDSHQFYNKEYFYRIEIIGVVDKSFKYSFYYDLNQTIQIEKEKKNEINCTLHNDKNSFSCGKHIFLIKCTYDKESDTNENKYIPVVPIYLKISLSSDANINEKYYYVIKYLSYIEEYSNLIIDNNKKGDSNLKILPNDNNTQIYIQHYIPVNSSNYNMIINSRYKSGYIYKLDENNNNSTENNRSVENDTNFYSIFHYYPSRKDEATIVNDKISKLYLEYNISNQEEINIKGFLLVSTVGYDGEEIIFGYPPMKYEFSYKYKFIYYTMMVLFVGAVLFVAFYTLRNKIKDEKRRHIWKREDKGNKSMVIADDKGDSEKDNLILY